MEQERDQANQCPEEQTQALLTQGIWFALSPAAVDNKIIDYSTTEGMKLYSKAIVPLSIQFSLEASKLNSFLQLFRARADSANWWPMLTFFQDGQIYNLVDHYGILKRDTIKIKGQSYTGRPSRDAQNSEQIYQCLLHSLTEAAQNKITVESKEYMLIDVSSNKNQPNGLLFLKHILSKS